MLVHYIIDAVEERFCVIGGGLFGVPAVRITVGENSSDTKIPVINKFNYIKNTVIISELCDIVKFCNRKIVLCVA